jgi:hypothetical protein
LDYSGWNNRFLANQYYSSLKEFVKDELTRIDRLIILAEIIEETIKINNYFLERFLEKKILIISEKNIILIERNTRI